MNGEFWLGLGLSLSYGLWSYWLGYVQGRRKR